MRFIRLGNCAVASATSVGLALALAGVVAGIGFLAATRSLA